MQRRCMLLSQKNGIVTGTFTAYIRKLGRVTVPDEVRSAYNLGEGDLLFFTFKVEKKAVEAVA